MENKAMIWISIKTSEIKQNVFKNKHVQNCHMNFKWIQNLVVPKDSKIDWYIAASRWASYDGWATMLIHVTIYDMPGQQSRTTDSNSMWHWNFSTSKNVSNSRSNNTKFTKAKSEKLMREHWSYMPNLDYRCALTQKL